MSRPTSSSVASGAEAGVYNPLHTIAEGDENKEGAEGEEGFVDEEDDEHHDHKHKAHLHHKKEVHESFDFNDCESLAWRKHQFRRFYQGKGKFWTATKQTTVWKWVLVVLTGILIAFVGGLVAVFTEALTDWKLETCYKLMEEKDSGAAFFAYQFMTLFLVLCAGALCWKEPAAAGSGIPEIKAYLNGVNLNSVVRIPVLVAKVFGMCFSCASGLPLGKEGPMIHAGSIIGAAVSQGNTISIGYNNSWTVFQDLRNDHIKRDFVTFGAAAGVAAAFRAPIGGILFTLEEGASFWSTETTFRAFICAVITHLTIGLLFPEAATSATKMFAFGQFDNLFDGRSNYRVYELPIFIIMGVVGGGLGALFNNINEWISLYRKKNMAGEANKWKRMVELVTIALTMSFISFVLPSCWQVCTPIPEITETTTQQEVQLIGQLVHFQCGEEEYNQLASLFINSGDGAMRQLFHFKEVDGVGLETFESGPLILFFIPYFLLAAVTSGVLAPAGLFVPTLLAGAAFGRLIGHWMNFFFAGYVADSGTYALIGASCVLGGMARMTIAGTVIVLEACGNITYLLPLMVTFASSRYAGNAINESMYDMQIHLKEMPFLEGSLHSLGMLNYLPVSLIMAKPVLVLQEVERVKRVMELLLTTKHNGFPVVNKEGRLRGLILRKTLCGMLKQKAYSTPLLDRKSPSGVAKTNDGGMILAEAATVSYENLERPYPNFPEAKALKLSDREMVRRSLSPSLPPSPLFPCPPLSLPLSLCAPPR